VRMCACFHKIHVGMQFALQATGGQQGKTPSDPAMPWPCLHVHLKGLRAAWML
jgi:hypothetical protein